MESTLPQAKHRGRVALVWLTMTTLAAGCADPPALGFPKGQIVAIEWDEVADRDGDRPLVLPRVDDPARIEAFLDSINQLARPTTPPTRSRATRTLHLLRDGRPQVDIGLIPSEDGGDLVTLFVAERFYEAPRGPVLEAIERLGFRDPARANEATP